MRLEATIPDSRGAAVAKLADELGMSRSEVVDEALTLFLKAVIEARKGRRLMMVDTDTGLPACELATPTLTAMEWTQQELVLPEAAVATIAEVLEKPPAPGRRLTEAMRRKR
ncbi:MAG: hypothetical protein ACOZNI_14905 [Myxococcota bacterium]